MIIPINISLDRIYESANLATEMINGEREYYTLFSFLDKMWKPYNDIVGDVYVKHMEPIHLSTYLQGVVPDMALIKQPSVFERTALDLTTYLLEK